MDVNNVGDGDVKLSAWKEDWDWMLAGVKEVRERLNPKPPTKLNWMCGVIESAVEIGMINARSNKNLGEEE